MEINQYSLVLWVYNLAGLAKSPVTYHTEFFSEAINHSSVNFGHGVEEVQSKAARRKRRIAVSNRS